MRLRFNQIKFYQTCRYAFDICTCAMNSKLNTNTMHRGECGQWMGDTQKCSRLLSYLAAGQHNQILEDRSGQDRETQR